MYRKFFKRLFDIVFSLLALPFFFILLLVISPIIYFNDKGSIFYIDARMGKNGKTFRIFKFRSMKENSPDLRNEDHSTYNAKDDPRLTKIGKIIRKTSIDEVPQILNVLRGDMSLVGPRPNMATTEFKQMDDVRKERLTVRPGITGYNQAYYRNSLSSEEKYKNDVYYVRNLSFILDVKIIIKTIFAIIKSKNIYKH